MAERNPYYLAALTILAPWSDDPRVAGCVTDDHVNWPCILERTDHGPWTAGERACLEVAANLAEGSTYTVDLGALLANATDTDFARVLDALRRARRALSLPSLPAADETAPAWEGGGPSRGELLAGIRPDRDRDDTEAATP